jgi:hypothetical protein
MQWSLSLQSWWWCLRCCSVVVSSKRTHKVEQNYTHPHKKNPTKCPKFKCNTVSVSFSACRCNSVVLSSKVGRKRGKKKSLETVLRMVSAAVACLPAAVSLLLLEVLFMQIWGVSLALTWPCRLCLLRVLLCESHCYKLSPFQTHWGRWHCTRFLRPACLFTVHVGSGSSPLSCGVFLPMPLLQAFPCLVTGHVPLLLPSPAPPPPRRSRHPTLFATCLYSSYCLLLSFSFFPWVGVSLSRGLCWSGPGLSVRIPQIAYLTCGPRLPKLSGHRGLVAAQGPS